MADIQLLGPTKRRILSKLREGSRSSGEVAALIGIQTSAARKHLERLREIGVVRPVLIRGSRGRPKKTYALTDEGHELFPRRYYAVLNGLLEALVTERGPDYARHLVTGVAETLARPVTTAPSSKRLARSLALLNDLGFEASVERRGRTIVITSRNCPLLRTAKTHRELVCVGLHAAIIRRAVGAKRVDRGKWIVDGDSVCTHTFEA